MVWVEVDIKDHLVPTSLLQNHSMFRVGRDLCGSSSPTLLQKQGHLQQAAQELVRAAAISRDIFNQPRLLGAPSSLALNPAREGAATASLGNLGQKDFKML